MSEEVNVKGDYSDQRSPGESVRRADGEEVTVSASVLLTPARRFICDSTDNTPEPYFGESGLSENEFVRCHTRVA